MTETKYPVTKSAAQSSEHRHGSHKQMSHTVRLINNNNIASGIRGWRNSKPVYQDDPINRHTKSIVRIDEPRAEFEVPALSKYANGGGAGIDGDSGN